MADLQPHLVPDPKVVAVDVRATHLLGVRERPDQLRGVPVVLVPTDALEDGAPWITAGAGRPLRLVRSNLVLQERRRAPGRVQGKVESALPFQETDLVGPAQPRLSQEGRKEDRGVDAVDEEEIKLDHLGRPLGAGGEVDCVCDDQDLWAGWRGGV